MKGLEFSMRNMSTKINTHNKDEAGRFSNEEKVDTMRNQKPLRAEGQKINEFARRRSIPKLACAQSILSSKLETESVQEKPLVTKPSAFETSEDNEPTAESMLDLSEINHYDFRKPTKKVNEKVMEHVKDEKGSFATEPGEASRKNMWREIQKGRLKGRRRPRLVKREENTEEEDLTSEKEINRGFQLRHIQKQWTSKERQEEESDKLRISSREPEQRNTKEDTEMRGPVPYHILSRVITNSFASTSSSSSSFNYSSAESEEVFSEGEEVTRRKDMRKSRSWRTFLTMMQWSKRRQSSWIQLAGHQGNIQLGEGGEVLKRFNEVEDTCLQELMSDPLHQFVPQYFGHISRNGEKYIRLEDLLGGLKQPVIMDCKMGIRTYQEEEIVKARTKGSMRSDMYQKMIKVDPTAPTEEEHEQKGVTKLHYMQWRDNISSTATLGFRIEGIMMDDGVVKRNFNQTKTKEEVTNILLFFTKRQMHILEAYLSRLQSLKETLKMSAFFSSHEVIGGSLLFVHDYSTSKANVWMIDFGKTTPMPENVFLKHDVPWVEGNREDGFLFGLASLISLLMEAIRQVRTENLEEHQPVMNQLNESDTHGQSQPGLEKEASDLLKRSTATEELD